MRNVPTDLTIVVVTYDSAHVVGALLDSLPAALDGLVADVVVVDNGSRDGTADLVAERTDCRLVRSTNVGYAGGLNRGVREAAPAPAVLILNPDVRMDPGSIQPLLAALDHDRVAIAAPRVRSDDGDLHFSLRRDPSLLRALGLSRLRHPALSEYVQEPAAYDHEGPVDWALGAIVALRRDVFDELGGWDESYFLYSEETDYCLRARDLGWATWFVPSSTAVHVGGGSGQNDLTHTLQIVNRVRLYSRRHAAPAAWAYYVLTLLAEATWVARGHSQSRASIRALLHPSARPAQLGLPRSLLPR